MRTVARAALPTQLAAARVDLWWPLAPPLPCASRRDAPAYGGAQGVVGAWALEAVEEQARILTPPPARRMCTQAEDVLKQVIAQASCVYMAHQPSAVGSYHVAESCTLRKRVKTCHIHYSYCSVAHRRSPDSSVLYAPLGREVPAPREQGAARRSLELLSRRRRE
jgi:hypothetical protein